MANQAVYEVPEDAGFLKKVSYKALEAIDLSVNLDRMSNYVDDVPNGGISAIMGFLSFISFVVFLVLALIYDLEPTWAVTGDIRASIKAFLDQFTFAPELAFLVGAIPLAVTMLPTVFEFLGSKAARFNIAAIQWMTWFFILLDLVSDTNKVNQEVVKYWAVLVPGDPSFLAVLLRPTLIGGAIAYYALWFLMLIASSYFFELIAALMAYATVKFVWKSVVYWALLILAGREAQRRKEAYEREAARGARRAA